MSDPLLARRPGGQTAEQAGIHRARVFVGRRCVLGHTLVCPLWTVWQEYQAFGERNGFEAEAGHLRRLLDAAPWAEVVERPKARGRLKTIVRGMGLKPNGPV